MSLAHVPAGGWRESAWKAKFLERIKSVHHSSNEAATALKQGISRF